MKNFSRLCQQLESMPFHRSKPALLAGYLQSVSEREASWALYLLLGGQLPRLISNEDLKRMILDESRLPAWLFDECHEKAGDFAETVALLGELVCQPDGNVAESHGPQTDLSLREWIEERLHPLAARAQAGEVETALREWWRTRTVDVSWALHSLAIGRFPVHVPRRVAEDAVKEAFGEEAVAALDARLAALPVGVALAGNSPAQLNLF